MRLPHASVPLALFVLVSTIVLAACGSDAVTTTGPTDAPDEGFGPVIEDISVPINERDLTLARHVFDTGKDRWDSLEPFAHTMSIGVETVSEVRISFDASGNVVSEKVVKADITVGETGLPRSVDEVFDVVDDLIRAFEDGRRPVPEDGECGHHFNAVLDADWGVPTRYDTLGPCEDGVGIFVTITRDEPAAAATAATAAEPVLDMAGDHVEIRRAWDELRGDAVSLERIDPPAIEGFEPFYGWLLADGRYLARGKWAGDEPIEACGQRRFGEGGPDDEPPEPVCFTEPGVRLFVIEADGSDLTSLSHVPELRGYSTAMSFGETPDAVIDAALLGDGTTVAYISGFSGAAYELPYELYTVELPAAG